MFLYCTDCGWCRQRTRVIWISFVHCLTFCNQHRSKERIFNSQFRHYAEKETPLLNDIAFLLHSHTRSSTLVDKFYHLGLCILYDGMLKLSANAGNSICGQFDENGIVFPASLYFNIFSTFTVDNIDHNPSSRTETKSWHGTAISATQNIDSADDGIQRPPLSLKKVRGKLYINFHVLILLSIHLFWNQVTCSFLGRFIWMDLKKYV